MIVLDVVLVYPPAVGISRVFAFRVGAESDLTLFLVALSVTATLVIAERISLWLPGRFTAC